MYVASNVDIENHSERNANFAGPVMRVQNVPKDTMLSPVLAFCSGPSFLEDTAEFLESDGIHSPDSGSKFGTQETLKRTTEETEQWPASPENENIESSIVTETTITYNPAVSVITDSSEFKLSSPKSCRTFQSSVSLPVIKTSIFENYGQQSSSEAEDEETARKGSGRMSKRLSELFSFSGGAASISGDENTNELKVDKKRRGSFSRKISPLPMALSQVRSAMFQVGQKNQPSAISKTAEKLEPDKDKELNKVRTPRAGRKLSLTMFKGVNPTLSKSEETPKRRNTDPVLGSKQRSSTIFEGNEPKCNSIKLCDSTGGFDIPEELRTFNGETKSLKNGIEPGLAFFKEEDIKIRDLMEDILRAHLLHMSFYKREACDRAGRNICDLIKTLIEAMKETDDIDTKVVCLVYIGAVRDEGIFMSAQALWNSDQDNFAAASFRNDSVYGMAICIITPLY